MSILLVLGLLAAPTGWVALELDSLPVEVYFDGEARTVKSAGEAFELSPGRHFVSLFGPRLVFRAFKDEAPETFWERLHARRLISDSDRDQLMSSYERGAVRVGTKWVYVVPDDTLPVQLLAREVGETYRRDSAGMLNTFLIVTTLVGLGMVLSVFFVKLG
ncbi:MAG TPA: hypothetical protein ENN51_02885 [candidate division WOR-3 bacterium]|mgnify:CR=1 FL=1|uniref:Uncharacterized protein n=1 Tax=candidate division WOR-3 bacterium TaxID=2052148 RepID=A0A7V0XEP2_UNCW3|nr:hypothetical protein [candidate division WOR-3 bacterium]